MTSEPTGLAGASPSPPSESITEKPTATPEAGAGSPPDANSAFTAQPAPSVTTVTPVVPSRRPQQIDAALLGLLLILSFLVASFTATNSDLFMNLAIGKRLSEGTFQFGEDPFSWATEKTETKPAPFWVHHGWLSSWIFYQLYRIDGGVGAWLILFKAILFTAAIGLLSRIGWKESSRWFVVICLTMAALAISPRLSMQPIVFSVLFLAVTMYVLHRAGLFVPVSETEQPTCPRCLWYLPPLFAVWANLDAWFILGPLLVGLCWLASGLKRWFGKASPVPGKTLGLVFAVGLLACVLNPHHVRVFQLPPELAYLLVTLGLPLPDALTGAGRTLLLLKQANPLLAQPWTMSPLSRAYWASAESGLNIAGMAFYPLLLLGIAAFMLTAMTKPQQGAPSLHIGRFLPWLVLAIMALMNYRMIPFFAIVAAPLTAMTLSEFLQWQQLQANTPPERRDRGLHLARFASVPFMLLLLFFAWPGWLHGSRQFQYNSPRHVAWHVRPDTSMQRAAQALQTLKEQGKCGNVFNSRFEFANYCAWFAPNVKCFMDVRFALFTEQATTFTRTELALSNPDRAEADWQKLFVEHRVDQVVLAGSKSNPRYWRLWNHAEQWRERYGDGQTALFSWIGLDEKWPLNTPGKDWNRRAFGEVPPDLRPPPGGSVQSAEMGPLDLYLKGTGPRPAAVMETDLLGTQYDVQRRNVQIVLDLFHLLSPAQAMPGGVPVPALWPFVLRGAGPDLGPPALPVLMVRCARRAVAENPYDPGSQEVLRLACEKLQAQEEYWVRSRGLPVSPLRQQVRQLQRLALLHKVALLLPESYQLQWALADVYQQNGCLDVALEYRQRAEKAFEAQKNASKLTGKEKEAVEMQFKHLQETVRTFEKKIDLRLAKLNEKSAGKTPVQVAQYAAFDGKYESADGDQTLPPRLGLVNKAVKILQDMQPSLQNKSITLTPEDQMRYLNLSLELYLARGEADVVAKNLKEEVFRNMLPPLILAHYQVKAGSVVGDYEAVEEGLKTLEKAHAEVATLTCSVWAASLLGFPPTLSGNPLHSAALMLPRSLECRERYNELGNTRALRGINALEAGETKNAHAIFDAAMGPARKGFSFGDEPIVKRYFELLDEQWSK